MAVSIPSAEVPDISPATVSGADIWADYASVGPKHLAFLEHATYCWNTRSLEPMTQSTMWRTAVNQVQVSGGRGVDAAYQSGVVGPRVEVLTAPVTQSRVATWFWGAVAMVVVWSVSYLLRQPGVAMGEPFS